MTFEDAPLVEHLSSIRRRGIFVQVTRSIRRATHDHEVPASPAYCLMLCVTPRPIDARAGFPDGWGPTRFEPLGDLSLLPPRQRLRIKGNRQRQVTITCLLSDKLVEKWLSHEIDWNDAKFAASLRWSNATVRMHMMQLAEEAHRPGLASEAVVDAIAAQLGIEVARFCDQFRDVKTVGGLAGWRLRLIDERLRNLSTVPSVEELAEICKLSVRQLSRGFRISRGVTLSAFCANHRIERAKQLLGGDQSIKEISYATGFASPASFAQSFRLATGLTPREFRQRMGLAVTPQASPSTVLGD